MPKERANIFPVQEIELSQYQLESVKILYMETEMYSSSLIRLQKSLSHNSILHEDIREQLIDVQHTMRMFEFAKNLFEKKTPLKIVYENWSNPKDRMYRLTDPTNWPHGGHVNDKQINRLFDGLWPEKESNTEYSEKTTAKASLSLRREVILKPLA